MKLFLNILIFCFVFLQSVISISQNVTASVESDSTLIGKELIYTIDVSSERVENIIFPDSTSFVPFELISEYQIDTTEVEEGFLFSKKYGILMIWMSSFALLLSIFYGGLRRQL